MNYSTIWRKVIKNNNSWVLFAGGTVVISLPEEIVKGIDLQEEAIKRLKALEIRNVAVAELVGQGQGWIVNCGNDYILSYVPHGEYKSRYECIASMISHQKLDQNELKVIEVFKR